MEHLSTIGSILLIHLLFLVTPGLAFMITVKNALAYSRAHGVSTVVGIVIGNLVFIAASLTGLALLISNSPVVLNGIKIFGVLYITYIGLKSFAKDSKIHITKEKKQKEYSKLQATKTGLLVTFSNPKAILFWLGLFSIGIPADTPKHILLLLIAIMAFNGFLWYSLVAIFFTQKRIYAKFLKHQNLLNKSFGGILILLALKIAFAEL